MHCWTYQYWGQHRHRGEPCRVGHPVRWCSGVFSTFPIHSGNRGACTWDLPVPKPSIVKYPRTVQPPSRGTYPTVAAPPTHGSLSRFHPRTLINFTGVELDDNDNNTLQRRRRKGRKYSTHSLSHDKQSKRARLHLPQRSTGTVLWTTSMVVLLLKATRIRAALRTSPPLLSFFFFVSLIPLLFSSFSLWQFSIHRDYGFAGDVSQKTDRVRVRGKKGVKGTRKTAPHLRHPPLRAVQSLEITPNRLPSLQ